jgi:hypothetical protein
MRKSQERIRSKWFIVHQETGLFHALYFVGNEGGKPWSRIGNSNGILVRRCWCGCAGQALQDEAGERLRSADSSEQRAEGCCLSPRPRHDRRVSRPAAGVRLAGHTASRPARGEGGVRWRKGQPGGGRRWWGAADRKFKRHVGPALPVWLCGTGGAG